MNQIHIQRLKTLSKHLKALKLSEAVEFDMAHWLYLTPVSQAEKSTTQVRGGKVVELKENFCNTSACMLGHAALIPEFNEAGLNVSINLENLRQGRTVGGDVIYTNALGNKFEETEAGQKFFGLTSDQAEAFFGGPWETAKAAAKAIDDFLADKLTIKYGTFYLRSKPDVEYVGK